MFKSRHNLASALHSPTKHRISMVPFIGSVPTGLKSGEDYDVGEQADSIANFGLRGSQKQVLRIPNRRVMAVAGLQHISGMHLLVTAGSFWTQEECLRIEGRLLTAS